MTELTSTQATPFHNSRTYWIAVASWAAIPLVGGLLSFDKDLAIRFALVPIWIVLAANAAYQFSILWSGYRARSACVAFTTLAHAAGIAAIPVAGWQAGVTIAACLALLFLFDANWVLSLAWQLNLGTAAKAALFAVPLAIPTLLFAQPFLWWRGLHERFEYIPVVPALSAAVLLALIKLCLFLSKKARSRARALLKSEKLEAPAA